MKKFLLICVSVLFSSMAVAKENVAGFWTTIDDETNTPKSVVQIYEYRGNYFGRVVELLKNKDATAKINGNPKIKGMDIIWDLEAKGDKYSNGKILDPTKGKVYGCEIWRDGDNLIVRGKIAFIGRNQTWIKNTDFVPENPQQNLIPQKPL